MRREDQERHRRRGPAQRPGDRVHAVGAPDPRRRDARRHDGVVGGMEDAVAEPGQGRCRQQPGEGRGEARQSHAAGQQRDARRQHAMGAEPVDHEARHDLPQPGRREERRHHQPKLCEADAEILPDQREQRRQHELEEVAAEMGDPHKRHDLGVAAKGQCGVGHGRRFLARVPALRPGPSCSAGHADQPPRRRMHGGRWRHARPCPKRPVPETLGVTGDPKFVSFDRQMAVALGLEP